MIAGIIAGSIAAVVAALVSLPLRSPDDILLNSATVVVGSLLAGIAAGVVWRIFARHREPILRFSLIWSICFTLAALVAVGGETQLDNFTTFVLPLAAIVFFLTGLLTVLLERTTLVRLRWLPAAAVVVALAIGIGLAGQGDEESGRLELPPRSGISIPSDALTLGQTPDISDIE